MKTQNIFRSLSRLIAFTLFTWAYFAADPVWAAGPTAEYKCTTSCSLCINFEKKTVCSEKYADDSVAFEKGKKLSRMVNDGLIIPSADIRSGFLLDAFSKKFFDCELMVKKAEQIKQATDNMCVKGSAKTVSNEGSFRKPASVEDVKDEKGKVSSPNIHDLKKSKVIKKTDGSAAKSTLPPPASSEMDDLIKQMQ